MDYLGYHATALNGLQSAMGDSCPTITWNGSAYKIIPGSAKLRKDFSTTGGFRMESDFSFRILVSEFQEAEEPTLKQTIVYLNQPFQIDAISTLPGGLILEIDCINPYQGA